MTPTEQDKELRKQIRKTSNAACNSVAEDGSFNTDEYLSEETRLIALITADRKRVALEARIQGIEEAHKVILGIVFAYTGGEGLENFCDVDDVSRLAMSWKVDRIAELKAQQEDV